LIVDKNVRRVFEDLIIGKNVKKLEHAFLHANASYTAVKIPLALMKTPL